MAKSKMKDLKTQELLAEIQNETKTFEQLAREVEGNIEREFKEAVATIKEQTAEEYVPRLCNALKKEFPDMKSKDIRLKVIRRMCPRIWLERTVRNWLPDWVKNPAMIDVGIAARQGYPYDDSKISHKNDLIENEDNKNRPVLSWTQEEYEETHPKIEESPFEQLGEINRSIARLWTALTGKKNMATMESDVKKDFVIPSRERFKDIVNGSSKIERDFLYNWLTWLNQVISDRITIIEKSDKTAYDTRE